MSTLFNVLFAWKCANTHHKMAMDALNQLQSEQAERWRDLCLANADRYLEGSKAPDNQFKDFRNHVLHVQENHWGGAVSASEKWYEQTVMALQQQRWSDAVYAAGVLSHYYTDPIQPLHTGQCEAENAIHRACEWSIACSYSELTDILINDLGGWPNVPVPSGADWLARMVTAGADLANPHYQICLDHYNLDRGVKAPPQGLDQELQNRFAGLIGYAVVGFARIMDRALMESQARIPQSNLTLKSVVATISIPIMWVTKKIKDAKERALVEAMYQEFQATGKVIATLSNDDKCIRELHASEVSRTPLQKLNAEAIPPLGTAHGTVAPPQAAPSRPEPPQVAPSQAAVAPAKPIAIAKPIASEKPVPAKETKLASASSENPLNVPTKAASVHPLPTAKAATKEPVKKAGRVSRFYLDHSMEVEKAPSIGPKMAARLLACGIETVGDLLHANPDSLSKKLNERTVDSETIRDWQRQASLCCDVPNLRGHDAQILTACGIYNRETLASANMTKLLKQVEAELAQGWLRRATNALRSTTE